MNQNVWSKIYFTLNLKPLRGGGCFCHAKLLPLNSRKMGPISWKYAYPYKASGQKITSRKQILSPVSGFLVCNTKTLTGTGECGLRQDLQCDCTDETVRHTSEMSSPRWEVEVLGRWALTEKSGGHTVRCENQFLWNTCLGKNPLVFLLKGGKNKKHKKKNSEHLDFDWRKVFVVFSQDSLTH